MQFAFEKLGRASRWEQQRNKPNTCPCSAHWLSCTPENLPLPEFFRIPRFQVHLSADYGWEFLWAFQWPRWSVGWEVWSTPNCSDTVTKQHSNITLRHCFLSSSSPWKQHSHIGLGNKPFWAVSTLLIWFFFLLLSMYCHILRDHDHLSVISLILSPIWEEKKDIYKIDIGLLLSNRYKSYLIFPM